MEPKHSIKAEKVWHRKKVNFFYREEPDCIISSELNRYYIDTPDGKLYFSISHSGVFIERIDRDQYIIRNNKIKNLTEFNKFISNYYEWRQLIIRMTKNGLFLFIQSDDSYYGEPAFKLYKS